MSQQKSPPRIGIPCDVFARGIHPFHGVGEKYINAVVHGVGGLPLLLPATGSGRDLHREATYSVENLLDSVDGLLLPGSPSNVEPRHYAPELADDGKADPQRDHLTLPLVRAALSRKMPVLAICRGFQELNVALGGSLHQSLQEQGNFIEHREDLELTREQQYSSAHLVQLDSQGWLAEWLDAEQWQVNSLHGQGIDRLATGLIAEAHAPDGLIEAVRLADEENWAMGVQWHPEWQFAKDKLSSRLFAEFGLAAERYSREKALLSVQ